MGSLVLAMQTYGIRDSGSTGTAAHLWALRLGRLSQGRLCSVESSTNTIGCLPVARLSGEAAGPVLDWLRASASSRARPLIWLASSPSSVGPPLRQAVLTHY